jgi:hypothetical protein
MHRRVVHVADLHVLPDGLDVDAPGDLEGTVGRRLEVLRLSVESLRPTVSDGCS